MNEAFAAMQPAPLLIEWQRQYGRHGLPWMVRDAYCRWVSEIMLQQTQVSVVKDYYRRFMERFPTVQALAEAPEQDVMRYWAGLGYYARARNLHACAKRVVQEYGGVFPDTVEALASLPGIGRSTAGAVASFAYDAPTPILDGNVKRVFTRLVRYEGAIGVAATEKFLWSLAQCWVPEQGADVYNQALMDLGSLVCTRTKPKCDRCPLNTLCLAYRSADQEAYPVRKPKKAKPTRSATMMLWRSDAGVWLQQREQKGVWQGLMSLPEVSEPEGRLFVCFEHVFSHYTLQAKVYVKTVEAGSCPSQSGRWVNRGALAEQAMPAPIERLLTVHAGELFAEHEKE